MQADVVTDLSRKIYELKDLPESFIESALPTRTEWESSLLLPAAERIALERAAASSSAMLSSRVDVDESDDEEEKEQQQEYYQILRALRASGEGKDTSSGDGKDTSRSSRRSRDSGEGKHDLGWRASEGAVPRSPRRSHDDDSLSTPTGSAFPSPAPPPRHALRQDQRQFMEAIASLHLDVDLEECSELLPTHPDRFQRRSSE